MAWLRNPNAQLTNWFSIFGGQKLERNIIPSDIDGIIEANGRFLAMEAKYVGETVSNGQGLMLWALAKQEGFTVVRVECGIDGMVEKIFNYSSSSESLMTSADFYECVNNWIKSGCFRRREAGGS